MSVVNAAGSVFAIASTYGSTVAITAASNASACVLTAASHGASVNDYVEIVSSGWGRMEKRVFRVSVVASNDITLEGFDTSSTTLFPAGQGTGTVRRISAWTNL